MLYLAFIWHMHQPYYKDVNRQAAEKLFSVYVGRPCKVQTVVQTEKDNPLVRAAMEQHGAKIVSTEAK